MEVRETCSKCGLDPKKVPICPKLKTHHSLLTKSLFQLSRAEKVKSKPMNHSKSSSLRILHMLQYRSHITMTALSQQRSHKEKLQCLKKVRDIDRSAPDAMGWESIRSTELFGSEDEKVNAAIPLEGSLQKKAVRKNIAVNNIDIDDEELARQKSRMERFAASKRPVSEASPSLAQNHKFDVQASADGAKIVGTLMSLEKPYFRLQEVPKPSDVRPIHVLKESFDFVMNKAAGLTGEKGNEYLNEQLKSIRQDLSIQQIENSFAILVYEAQARLSLELRDLVEFNQCQSRLLSLYEKAKSFTKKERTQALQNEEEFLLYRILYAAIMQTDFGLCAEFARLSHDQRIDSSVEYALELVSAITSNNPAHIFLLFHRSVEFSYCHWLRCLLRKLIEVRRSRWCITLLGTCGPRETMAIFDVALLLGFHLDHDASFGVLEDMKLGLAIDDAVKHAVILTAIEFFASMNATIYTEDGKQLETSTITDASASVNYQYLKCYIACAAAAKQVSEYLAYCHTRHDARHASQATGTL